MNIYKYILITYYDFNINHFLEKIDKMNNISNFIAKIHLS